VDVQDDGGSTASGQVNVIVDDAPIGVSVLDPGATEGQPANNAIIGTLSDGNTYATAADFSGTIDWGDGPNGPDGTDVSDGTFQATSQPGVFNILGSHTYAEEGGYDVVISANDDGGSSNTNSGYINVADASISLSPEVQVRGTEGLSTGLVTVATLNDTNLNAPISDFANNVNINWGDGNSSVASLVSQGNGVFLVQGFNTYTEEGIYNLTVSASDAGGSVAPAVPPTLVDIKDASISLTPATPTAIEGQPFNYQLIATLQDTDTLNTDATDFNGTVTFGDGGSDALTFVAMLNGQFAVLASHNYLEEGNYGMNIQVQDVGGASTSGSSTMVVADAPLNATPNNAILPYSSATFSGIVANFTDTDPNGTLTDYAAMIDWGDGSARSLAVLSPASGPSWNVGSTHTYTLPAVYTLTVTIEDLGDGLGGASIIVNPQIAVVPHMNVARINNNTPNGYLTANEETSPGAFVPLDNNDWDYDGTVDMNQSGPVPGDQYLLPVTLPGLTGATAGDGYTLTASEGIKIYLGSDRSSPYTGQVLPAASDQTVYIEGVSAGGVNAPETLVENFSIGSTSRSNLDIANVIVFTLNGPLDVPGATNYDYTCDSTLGGWLTPNGGMITGGSNTAGPSGSNAVINWDNTPEVAYGEYQVNSDYTWGIGVNVVAVTLNSSSFVYYGGAPAQSGTSLLVESSPPGAAAAMTATAKLSINGPTINGIMRGVGYINAGFVQDAKFTSKNGVYADGSALTSNLQDGSYHIDYATDDPANGIVRSTPPWYDSNNSFTTGFWSVETASPGNVSLSIEDTPKQVGTNTFYNGTSPLSSVNIRFDVRDYLLAVTTADVNGSASVYDDLGQAAWSFQGSGRFFGVTPAAGTTPAFGTWAGYSWDGVTGDGTFGSVTSTPITAGTPCNDLLNPDNHLQTYT
jgi:hypothetical protein